MIHFIDLILNLGQLLFGFLVFMLSSKCNPKIPMKVIIIRHEILNRVKVHKHLIELSQKEETGGHALSSWNGVAFLSGSTDYLKELMG